VLWPDGAVEFKKWTPGKDPVISGWIALVTGGIPDDEGFANLISTTGPIPRSTTPT